MCRPSKRAKASAREKHFRIRLTPRSPQEPRPARLNRSTVKRVSSKNLRVMLRVRRRRDLRPRPNRSSRVKGSTKAKDSKIKTPYQADHLVLHPRNTPSKVKTKRKARGSKTNPPRQEDLLVLRQQNIRIKAKAKRGVMPRTESKMPVME